MSIVIRLLADSELAEADAVIQAAFERTTSSQPWLLLHRSLEPDGFWVAEDRGRMVGTVGAIPYDCFAYVALMTVHPDAQSRGIGRRLMDHVLEWLDRRGCPMALLDATEKGARLYETMGFVDDATAYELVRDASPPLPPCSTEIRPVKESELPEIATFDAPLFGADRGGVLRAQWRERGERGLVARDRSGTLQGYLFACDPVLGPWAAISPRVAQDLLAAALSLSFAQAPLVMVPRSNQFALELLGRFGFSERRKLRHMRRGGNAPPGQPSHLYGQASFGHG